MQRSIWLLAFLPCLPWFGSLVDGAAVLSIPSNTTRIVQPLRLNDINGLPVGLSVIDKERGAELPGAQLFEAGIWLMANFLAPYDFFGYIQSQAWSTGDIILGMSVDEQQGVAQRGFLMYGFYLIFLLMKQEKDFRAGVFEIQYGGTTVCDLVILPIASSGMKLAPSFAHVTQLKPPPSPIADGTNSSLQIVAVEPGALLKVTPMMPFLIHPMDELGLLISVVDMLVTAAQPPANEPIRENIESIVPFSGVNISLSLAPNKTPKALTYDFLIWALSGMSDSALYYGGQALRGQMYFLGVYLGEITMIPSNSVPTTSPLIEAIVNASTSTATARKKRSTAQRLWNAGRS